MLLIVLLQLVFWVQDEVPYKPDDEFSVKFELAFKTRGEIVDNSSVKVDENLHERADRMNMSPLPYMVVKLEVLKANADEPKLKVLDASDEVQTRKKASESVKVILLSEFTDDLKANLTSFKRTVYFITKDGAHHSKVIVEFDEDGFYYLNGKKKGKI